MYSRWLGGWAVREAGTAGWTPQRSASSLSTASWTDPSWLRPLTSWVTRGSGSDRPQLSRTECESNREADGKTENHHGPWRAAGRRGKQFPRSAQSSALAVRFYAQTVAGDGTWVSLCEVSTLLCSCFLKSELHFHLHWLSRHALQPSAVPLLLRASDAVCSIRWGCRHFYEPE